MAWFAAFQTEAGAQAGRCQPVVRYRIANGDVGGELDDGEVVSLAGRNAAAAGVSRVGVPVTPPEHRRRGDGAAVTAAGTADRWQGTRIACAFTDLANPTSTRSGGRDRPVCDRKVIHFTG